jgi:lipopolysaccharide/colanic/teichoic acid biosynthesis glycosyltransferase
MGKRVFDLVFAAVAIVVLLVPMVLLAMWIRLDSPGPALFRQKRVGLHGREFAILKFRTMRAMAGPSDLQVTVGADARITRAGKFLRKFKIDELPQFLNVVLGDMSIVGPRPEVPRYVALYPPAVRETVLSVRPGITDLASIAYRSEAELLARSTDPEKTYIEEVMPAKLELYLQYVRQRSFLGDLAIIGRTVRASLQP